MTFFRKSKFSKFWKIDFFELFFQRFFFIFFLQKKNLDFFHIFRIFLYIPETLKSEVFCWTFDFLYTPYQAYLPTCNSTYPLERCFQWDYQTLAASVRHPPLRGTFNSYFLVDTSYTTRARSTVSIRADQYRTGVTTWPEDAHVRSRKTLHEVPYQVGSGGSLFLQTSCKNASKVVSKKGPWTGRYHSLTSFRAIHFWILENQELKPPVDSSSEAALRSSRQKSIIFRNTEDGQQNLMCSTDGKSASRNNA